MRDSVRQLLRLKYRFLMLVLLGCESCGNLMQPDYTRSNSLTKDELTGEYIAEVTPTQRRDLIHSSLILTKAKFSVRNLPDFWSDPDFRWNGSIISESGTWAVTREAGTSWTISLHPNGSKFTDRIFSVLGSAPDHDLYLSIGDPDLRRGITFFKAR